MSQSSVNHHVWCFVVVVLCVANISLLYNLFCRHTVHTTAVVVGSTIYHHDYHHHENDDDTHAACRSTTYYYNRKPIIPSTSGVRIINKQIEDSNLFCYADCWHIYTYYIIWSACFTVVTFLHGRPGGSVDYLSTFQYIFLRSRLMSSNPGVVHTVRNLFT